MKSKSSGEFADHLFKIKISDIADEQINFLLNEKPLGLWHEIAQPITASWKPPTIQVQGAGQVTYEISGPDKDSIELNPVGWANSRNVSRIDFTHGLVGEIDAMGGRMPMDANYDYVYEFSITARTNNTDGTENLEKQWISK